MTYLDQAIQRFQHSSPLLIAGIVAGSVAILAGVHYNEYCSRKTIEYTQQGVDGKGLAPLGAIVLGSLGFGAPLAAFGPFGVAALPLTVPAGVLTGSVIGGALGDMAHGIADILTLGEVAETPHENLP